eukprot:Polyplicarium_translucidae@DN1184_c0_g1_i1.p1
MPRSRVCACGSKLTMAEVAGEKRKLVSTEGRSAKAAKDASGTSVPWPWVELHDAARGRSYFFNSMTRAVRWKLPADAATASIEPQAPPFVKPAVSPEKGATVGATDGDEPVGEDCPPGLAYIASNLAVYVRKDRKPTAKELGRPARKQADVHVDTKKYAYEQGNEQYNIWYGKFLTDRFDKHEEREPALSRLNPYMDSGWTQADVDPEDARCYFCIYFAKGCCTRGSDCRYYHRIPTQEDNDELDLMHDVFGRERHAQHRDDMDGTGCFTSDCRTLFCGEMKINRMSSDYMEKTEQLIRKNFGVFGEIEQLKFIGNKNISFVKFPYRAAAEFAKVAMAEQKLDPSRTDEVLVVKWAHSDPNPKSQETDDDNQRKQARSAVVRRMRALGYDEDYIACLTLWGDDETPVSHYPDTSAQFDSWSGTKEGKGQLGIGPALPEVAPTLHEIEAQDRETRAVRGVEQMQQVLNRIGEIDSSAFDVSLNL